MAAKKRKPKSRSGTSQTPAERRARGLELLSSIWLPAELLRDVDALAESTGSNRTAVVRAALAAYLRIVGQTAPKS